MFKLKKQLSDLRSFSFFTRPKPSVAQAMSSSSNISAIIAQKETEKRAIEAVYRESVCGIHFNVTETTTSARLGSVTDDKTFEFAKAQFFTDASRGGYHISHISGNGEETVILDEGSYDSTENALLASVTSTIVAGPSGMSSSSEEISSSISESTYNDADLSTSSHTTTDGEESPNTTSQSLTGYPALEESDKNIDIKDCKTSFFDKFNGITNKAALNIIFHCQQLGYGNEKIIDLQNMFFMGDVKFAKKQSQHEKNQTTIRNIKTIVYDERDQLITVIEPYFVKNIVDNEDECYEINGFIETKQVFHISGTYAAPPEVDICFPLTLLTRIKDFYESRAMATETLTPLQSAFITAVKSKEAELQAKKSGVDFAWDFFDSIKTALTEPKPAPCENPLQL
jgi:hypothetical protein